MCRDDSGISSQPFSVPIECAVKSICMTQAVGEIVTQAVEEGSTTFDDNDSTWVWLTKACALNVIL